MKAKKKEVNHHNYNIEQNSSELPKVVINITDGQGSLEVVSCDYNYNNAFKGAEYMLKKISYYRKKDKGGGKNSLTG